MILRQVLLRSQKKKTKKNRDSIVDTKFSWEKKKEKKLKFKKKEKKAIENLAAEAARLRNILGA